MSAAPDSAVPATPARGRAYTIAASVLLAVAAIAAAISIYRFAEAERRRDLAQWSARLDVVADSRFAAIQSWLDQNLGDLRGLAENQSVQLYMTELAQARGDKSQVTDEQAQLGYLRNLLTVTADRAGFGGGRSLGATVGANLRVPAAAAWCCSTPRARRWSPRPRPRPIDEALIRRIAEAPKDKPSILDLFAGAGGQPTIGFLAPIFAVQADPGTSPRIGLRPGFA